MSLFTAEFIAEAIPKCAIHKRLLFFWICDMRFGYARVSTDDQTLDLQRDALERARCRQTYGEHACGKTTYSAWRRIPLVAIRINVVQAGC
jgi:hypothetical protein